MKKFKYFIFDLDGTLAYTIEDLKDSMNEMCRSFGWVELTTEQVLANINCGAMEFVKKSMPKEHQDNEELAKAAYKKYQECYSRGYMNKTVLYPAVKEGIEYLKGKGAKLAVFSNKQDSQTKAVTYHLFSENTFDEVLGHDGRFPHKPCPDGALYITERWGASADEVAFVGDSDVDMMLAQNAGFHKIGVSWGYRPKELLLEKGAELIICGLDDIKRLV